MATARERAETLLKKYSLKRCKQIADTMICASIGVEDEEELDYWEIVYNELLNLDIEEKSKP